MTRIDKKKKFNCINLDFYNFIQFFIIKHRFDVESNLKKIKIKIMFDMFSEPHSEVGQLSIWRRGWL